MPRNPNTTSSIDHQPPQPIGSGGKTLLDPPRSRTPDLAPDPNFLNSLGRQWHYAGRLEIATGQQEPSELQLRKADLEVEKLEL